MNRQPLTVAVVGATGVVGRTMIQILNEREFPVGELRLLASGRSAGRTVSVDGRTLEIGEAVPEAFEGVDIALFSAGADVSKELAPAAVACGATVIDNSSAWRMDPTVPLVVSQVNAADLEGHPGIIANPNCSTMQMAPILMALRDTVGLERVVADTYQSVSGTGADALAELESQIRAHVAGETPVATVYPHPVAFNALPEAFEGVDIALFSAGADVSKDLAPAAVACGATVIDNSSAWRMDPMIPLVVSQVNAADLEGHPGIIANPNCSTMQMVVALKPIDDAVGIERLVISTYQSVS
ncbi:MAG: aspartate-semialdehyde dehydrogenase, partial [Chloroflexota bacterium]